MTAFADGEMPLTEPLTGNFSDVTEAWRCPELPATHGIVQQCVRDNSEEDMKALY